jgi:hypothetical protein
MAFGRPGKGAALLYLGLALGGLAVSLYAETFWVRILGLIALLYSLFCLLITGAIIELLPATRATDTTSSDREQEEMAARGQQEERRRKRAEKGQGT